MYTAKKSANKAPCFNLKTQHTINNTIYQTSRSFHGGKSFWKHCGNINKRD